MFNPQWLELPISRTNLHGPKDVRDIEVLLYFDTGAISCVGYNPLQRDLQAY